MAEHNLRVDLSGKHPHRHELKAKRNGERKIIAHYRHYLLIHNRYSNEQHPVPCGRIKRELLQALWKTRTMPVVPYDRPITVGKISRTVQFLPFRRSPVHFYRKISTSVLVSYSTRGIRRSGCIQMAVRWVVKTETASEVSGCTFSRLGVPYLRVLGAGSPQPPNLAYHLTACLRIGSRPRQEAINKNQRVSVAIARLRTEGCT
jgi:hypothetical protein